MWEHDAWVQTKLRSGAETQERVDGGEFDGVWMAHETYMCPCRMPSPTDGGTLGGTL